jgi:O-antigen/teichoic acid export membrane protein
VDSTTHPAVPTQDPGSSAQAIPVLDRQPPSGLWLVRWGLAIHAALCTLIALTLAVDLAADTTAPTIGAWLQLALALAVSSVLAVVGQRVGRGRPTAWLAAVGLQVLVAAGYAVFTRSLLVGPEPGLAPAWLTLPVGGAVVLATLAGIGVCVGASVRSYCLQHSR